MTLRVGTDHSFIIQPRSKKGNLFVEFYSLALMWITHSLLSGCHCTNGQLIFVGSVKLCACVLMHAHAHTPLLKNWLQNPLALTWKQSSFRFGDFKRQIWIKAKIFCFSNKCWLMVWDSYREESILCVFEILREAEEGGGRWTSEGNIPVSW